jgi:ATP-binding cassette subfamily A (ABC1) protein 3
MLKEYRRDRIILLTTHYMDEADILGDRIGIMAAGKLVCLGSSMFLKRRYGVGYNMTMIKASKTVNDLVMPYFWTHLGNEVKKMSEIQSEITLQIPKEYASKFKNFFANFDHDLYSLKIVAYGVSITTLEDVFMKVGHMDDDNDDGKESVFQRSASIYSR